jgi:polyhydroxybutyrate depolymerase
MTRRRSTLLVGGLALLALLAAALWVLVLDRGTAEGGTELGTLKHDGLTRTYRVHRPGGDTEGRPLVVVLHGASGSGVKIEEQLGWDALADEKGFVVAYPDGIEGTWNIARICCGAAAQQDVDDTGFVTALVDRLERTLHVDRSRVYLAGISNGGALAYQVASHGGDFAAMAVLASTELGDCPSPAKLSVLIVHGSADPIVRYDGKPGVPPLDVDGPSIPEVAQRWRDREDCGAPVTNTASGSELSSATCAGGRAVEVLVHPGGHIWPPGAEDWIWKFFVDHSR